MRVIVGLVLGAWTLLGAASVAAIVVLWRRRVRRRGRGPLVVWPEPVRVLGLGERTIPLVHRWVRRACRGEGVSPTGRWLVGHDGWRCFADGWRDGPQVLLDAGVRGEAAPRAAGPQALGVELADAEGRTRVIWGWLVPVGAADRARLAVGELSIPELLDRPELGGSGRRQGDGPWPPRPRTGRGAER